ncbi:Vvs1 protein [Maudiozyma humilis]|uniref:Vvs1 protein n=1 Tax=Maudiozyma humilis TaxID=51915 RepID=A0AAV5S4W5_MAUHU|nr:Vvs1 protein [Kazachstania humilis]
MPEYGATSSASATPRPMLTRNLVLSVAVACLGAVQFGYHIAELNAPEQAMTCKKVHIVSSDYDKTFLGRVLGLPQCLELSEQQFGAVTAVFSLGGLVGSLFTGRLANVHGRRATSLWVSLVALCGSLLMFLAGSFAVMLLGRFVAGVSCGAAIVITPLFINEVSPPQWKGTLGAMNQLSINLGILLTQGVAVKYASEFHWRWILFVGAALAVVNALGWLCVAESPKWLVLHQHDPRTAERVLMQLRNGTIAQVKSEVQQWTSEHRDDENGTTLNEPGFWEYVRSPHYQRPRRAITMLLVGQQFSGINSIIFYGVKVVSQVLPSYSLLVNLAISVENVVVTLCASLAIERCGRKPLLLGSAGAMAVMSLLISGCIILGKPLLLVAAMFGYIGSFAMGVGPIPFLIIGELSPAGTGAVAQSYGTVCNWLATFVVGYAFPVANAAMGGYVYVVFSALTAVLWLYVKRELPETRGTSSASEVWL